MLIWTIANGRPPTELGSAVAEVSQVSFLLPSDVIENEKLTLSLASPRLNAI